MSDILGRNPNLLELNSLDTVPFTLGCKRIGKNQDSHAIIIDRGAIVIQIK